MHAVSTQIDGDIVIVSINESRLNDDDQINRVGMDLRKIVGDATTNRMLLDLKNVAFLASAMVGELFILNRACRSKSIILKMCNVHPVIRDIFETVCLHDFVEIAADVSAARTAFEQDPMDGYSDTETKDLKYIRSKANKGDVDAQFELAKSYIDGSAGEPDAECALEWLQKAAAQGHSESQYQLGKSYAFGIGIQQDYDEAMKWYRQAGDQGHAEAQYSLAMSYRYGIAVPEDDIAAVAWYRKAAKQGHEKAKEELNCT